MKLAQAEAQNVWSIFQEMCQVPRPSKHEEKIIAWVEQYAQARGWPLRKDKVGNVVIRVEGSAGYEDAPAVVLQGHLDMVCEKNPEKEHDFFEDSIVMVEKDGWVYADDTTLGADNGIGVAYALALAEEEGLAHPPLELLFTVDEETGLTGASELTGDFLEGRVLINIDSEDEGVFTLGCAGGTTTDIKLAVEYESSAGMVPYKLAVSGLVGGHSGINIGEPRGNAVKVLGLALNHMVRNADVHLAHIKGGQAHNAIPRNAEAVIYLTASTAEDIGKMVYSLESMLKADYAATDPELALSLSETTDVTDTKKLTGSSMQTLLNLICALPHGVERYSTDIENLPETSTNLAKIETSVEESWITIVTSKRSSRASGLQRICGSIKSLSELAGGEITLSGQYPAWEPNMDSALLKTCCETYRQEFDKEPVTEVIHAGLECGLIGAKYPGMDMISLGPTLENPHSPQERINIETVDQVWRFLKALLGRLK